MMALQLRIHTQPEVPLEAECLCPDRLYKLESKAILSLPVWHGNRKVELGDFFDCSGKAISDMALEGDLSQVKYIGSGMSLGRIFVDGHVGLHTGARMQGGEIVIEGNAGDWLAAEMLGGKIVIKGNAGHMVGSGYRGSRIGMQGGEIIVHGDVKNELGNSMRRGLIVVGGSSQDFTGVNMLAGTIIVLGNMGIRAGAGMQRGSIICQGHTEVLPTFTYSCCYQPTFLQYYFSYLHSTIKSLVNNDFLTGKFDRWCGDSVELNRGEILLYRGK